MSADTPLRPSAGPPCPQCASALTVRIVERYGVSTYFCGDCQHAWELRPDPAPHESATPSS